MIAPSFSSGTHEVHRTTPDVPDWFADLDVPLYIHKKNKTIEKLLALYKTPSWLDVRFT